MYLVELQTSVLLCITRIFMKNNCGLEQNQAMYLLFISGGSGEV